MAIISFRTSPETKAALEALADRTKTTSSALADQFIVQGLGNADVRALSSEAKAGRKAAVDIKMKLLRALRDELEAIEAENE